MRGVLIKVIVPSLTLGIGTAAAHGVLIRNVTNDTTLFDSRGFEYDAPGGAPVTSVGFWSNGEVTHDRVVTGGAPGAFEGNNYLATTRDGAAAGNPRAFISPVQATAGNLIHAEWMMYVTHPHLSDIGFALHNNAGANIGQIRIGGNGLGTIQDSWGGTIRSSAYQANLWQKWEVDYTIGQSNYAVKVNGAAPFNATVPGGSTGFGYLSFFHNGNQTYHLDAVASSMPGQYDPQPQQSLRRMIDIDWSLGPRTPKGMQDSAVGVAQNTLLTVGGFNNGSGPGERGFHHETWGLNLASPGSGWQNLPAYPGSNNPSNVDGAGRQG